MQSATIKGSSVQTRQKPLERNEHDRLGTKRIIRATRFAERRWRERIPLLNLQTMLGVLFLIGSVAAFGLSTYAFLSARMPFYVCIVINAVAISILREIEHDLIHNLYFRGRRYVQNALLFFIWPFLGNSFNPLHRRHLHLQHHRVSGDEHDIEERIIGNGMKFGFRKLVAMLDTGSSLSLRIRELKSIPGFSFTKLMASIFPVAPIFYTLWYAFLLVHTSAFSSWLFGVSIDGPTWWTQAVTVLNAMVVIWIAPNLIRQASLQILSSNLHYYGDIEGTLQQAQVFSRWYLLPFQLFTFNFGATHAIHHFVVNQPFYLRQLVAPAAHRAMRRHGVRFNDMDTILRANAYQKG